MQALKQYIEQQNALADIFKGPKLPTDPTQLTLTQRVQLADRVESELSPENLTCDGELAPSRVRAKARFLNSVQHDIQAL